MGKNADNTIKEIFLLNEDEQFYKKYYEARKSEKLLKDFLSQVDIKDAKIRHLVIPELLPEIISYNMNDGEYFSESDNISIFISRHNRYTPAFMHKHDFFEIIYVYEGRCTQNIGMNRLNFTTGDFIFIAPNVFHTMEVFDDTTMVFNILLRKSSFHEMFIPLTRSNDLMSEFFSEGIYNAKKIEYLIFHTGRNEKYDILKIYQEQLHRDLYTNQILIGMMTIISADMMRNYGNTMESSYKSGHAKFSKDFMILNYIQENLETVTLSDISEHFGFSVSYCCRLIKSATGMGFREWKCAIRMRKAEHMLINTNKTVMEISDSLGYVNPETFIRAFKKEIHMTPSQYRKHAVHASAKKEK